MSPQGALTSDREAQGANGTKPNRATPRAPYFHLWAVDRRDRRQPVDKAAEPTSVRQTENSGNALVTANSTASIVTSMVIMGSGATRVPVERPPGINFVGMGGTGSQLAVTLSALGVQQFLIADAYAKNLAFKQAPELSRKGHIEWLDRALQSWGITITEASVLLGLGSEQQAKSLLEGYTSTLGRDLSDRIRLLLEIDASLSSVLRHDAQEREWLREPNAALENQSPLSLMLDGSMRSLILVKELLDYASGR